jgi:hypothetical protein
MPWLPLYLLEDDINSLIDHFDDDPNLAWIAPNGPGKWIAQRQHPVLDRPHFELWHFEGGPLPLLKHGLNEPDGVVPDPWNGWAELRQGADPSFPYFGPGPVMVYHLTLRYPGGNRLTPIPISGVGWIGRHYSILGEVPASATEKHWRRLRRWVSARARCIRRADELGVRNEIWTFP